MLNTVLRSLAIALTALALISCGGSSGDTTTPTSPEQAAGPSFPQYDLSAFIPTNRPAVFGGSSTQSTCAILPGNVIKCWGFNEFNNINYGVLGIEAGGNRGDQANEMGSNLPAVNIGTGLIAKQLALGGYNACALISNGRVKCWGYGQYGVNGQGNTANAGDVAGTMGDALPFINLGTGRSAKMLSLGVNHACAVLDNNSVKCWGRNNRGQLGQGDTTDRGDSPNEMGDSLLAVNLGTGRTAKYVVAGNTHTCAHLDNDTVKCWGDNANGKLGLGDTNARGSSAGQMGDALPTVDQGLGRTVKQISAGREHTCARLDNDYVKCWGKNSSGQLGMSDALDLGDQPGEVGVNYTGIGGGVQWVFSTGDSTCAKVNNTTIWCWGRNIDGQLAEGNTANRGTVGGEMAPHIPNLNMGAGRSVVQMAGGEAHMCAALDNNTIKCWGSGGSGATGSGSTANIGTTPATTGDGIPEVQLIAP